MIPGTSMTRFVIVMTATIAAIIGVALAFGDAQPLLALGLTLVILAISSAVLPSRTWIKFTDGVRQIAQALGWRGLKPPRIAVTIRQWRDERIEERRLRRQLLQMDAHDSEDFNGKGLPRKEWAAFNEALAGVLREMRSSEGHGK